jgi:hypothetical protein
LEVGCYVVGERYGQRSWYFRLFLSIPLIVFLLLWWLTVSAAIDRLSKKRVLIIFYILIVVCLDLYILVQNCGDPIDSFIHSFNLQYPVSCLFVQLVLEKYDCWVLFWL